MFDSAPALAEELCRRHDADLRRFLVARVRREEVSDLVQECYLRLLAVDDPAGIRHPRAFLLRIASNLAADRARRRAIEVTSGDAPTDFDALPAPDASLEETLDLDRLVASVDEALATLPEMTARVFRRRRVEGVSSTQIALELGVTPRTIQKHLAVAMVHLYESIGPLNSRNGE